MRTLFIACLLGLGLHGQAQAAAEMDSTGAFQAVFEVRPSSEQVYQLGWIKQGLAKQQAGRISTLIKLDCLEELDEDMQLKRHQSSMEGAEFRCSYEAGIQGSPIHMGLERSCRLVFNSAFFELICKEDYSGGAHPDSGANYYYLDKNAEPVPEEQRSALLGAAKPEAMDLQQKSMAMIKSCNTWFVQNGERLSREDLASLIGTPQATRAGVTKEGRPLIGMSYYLVRVARGNPCDQKTFWVKVDNAAAWESLTIKGVVQRLK